MNNYKIAFPACVAVAMIFAPGFRLCAEPPPDPPLVAPAPDGSTWTIDVKQKKPLPPPPSDPKWVEAYKRALEINPRILRVTNEKSGKDRLKETSYENGKTATMYIYKGYAVYRSVDWPSDKALALPAGYRDSPVKGGGDTDFSDLSWIRPEVFVKTVTYHGQRCHYYQDNEAAPLAGGGNLDPAATNAKGVKAWIDASTRLPVAVEDNAMLKKFHFLKGAPVSIELKGIFATAYNQATKRVESSPPEQ
ncbi:MAG: hypothetical protein WCD79_00470 [Chthoniobacteraceae bacterium]